MTIVRIGRRRCRQSRGEVLGHADFSLVFATYPSCLSVVLPSNRGLGVQCDRPHGAFELLGEACLTSADYLTTEFPLRNDTILSPMSALKLVLLLSATTVSSVFSSSSCVGTISSLDDVAAAVKCTTVNINSFIVPAGKTFDLSLAAGTTVNLSE